MVISFEQRPTTLEFFKKLAKKFGRECNISHRKALELFAEKHGFPSFYEALVWYELNSTKSRGLSSNKRKGVKDSMKFVIWNTPDPSHLEQVINEMQERGAPHVCGVLDELYGIGKVLLLPNFSHRIIAAKKLGIQPVVHEIMIDNEQWSSPEIEEILAAEEVLSFFSWDTPGLFWREVLCKKSLLVVDFADGEDFRVFTKQENPHVYAPQEAKHSLENMPGTKGLVEIERHIHISPNTKIPQCIEAFFENSDPDIRLIFKPHRGLFFLNDDDRQQPISSSVPSSRLETERICALVQATLDPDSYENIYGTLNYKENGYKYRYMNFFGRISLNISRAN